MGSSPLTRGKPVSWRPPRPDRWAHPRSRGENEHSLWVLPTTSGSSPLAQGKPQVTVEGIVEEGIIPAHAGKTLHDPAHRSASTAHPRSRGENPGQLGTGIVGAGSSPLTRGKPIVNVVQRLAGRLIPTHAGKTARSCARRRSRSAHPRSRGENDTGFTAEQVAEGSSPLTRGKHELDFRSGLAERLIPAHAGKT